MNRPTQFVAALVAAAVCSLPLLAAAQTSTPMDKSQAGKVLPADQPRSESERKATTETGQAPKYGQTDPNAADTMDKSDMNKSTSTRKRMRTDKTDKAATGDVPTYPANTKDGRKTGESNITK